VSKRSYRRLAVVAGAALAVGSTAPAMAQRIDARAVGTAAVSADAIDVSDVLGGVQSTDLSLPTGLAFETLGSVRNTVGIAAPILTADVLGLLGPVQCAAGSAIGTALDANAGALATVGVSGGTISANVGALVGAPLTLFGAVTECVDELKSDVFTTLSHGRAAVGAASGIATNTALSAVAYAGSLPGAVVSTASPFSLLDQLINVTATGGASALVSIM
jgi:hypothetical protein